MAMANAWWQAVGRSGRPVASWRVTCDRRIARASQAHCNTFRQLATGASGIGKPVLRFAPSPTGQLHLGGLRTALFNHLFARKTGGKWILRVEDTDTKRLVPGAIEAMQDILAWAGLDYDEGPDKPARRGPYIQSQRLNIYAKYAERLIDDGHAYRDFRVAASGPTPPTIRDEYVPPSKKEAEEMIKAGKTFVVRLRLQQRKSILQDIVYGKLEFPYDAAIDDPIIVKSDGWPTYHLASVVDDGEMQVTHVLRGEEWLPSVPVHLALYSALDLKPPQFAHLPLLVNPDGSKLSKRHADVHVESYRQSGMEPDALLNFVALMGANWHATTDAKENADDTSEVFTIKDMTERFSLERITHSRATPNIEKLNFLNRQHLRRRLADSDDGGGREKLLQRLNALLESDTWQGSEYPTDRLEASRIPLVADAMLERSHSLPDMVRDLQTLFAPPTYEIEEAQAMRAEVDDGVYVRALSSAHDMLTSLTEEEADSVNAVETKLKTQAKTLNTLLDAELNIPSGGTEKTRKTKYKGRGALLKPFRYALTGRHSGPTVAETIAILGKQRCLERVSAASS